MFRELETLPQDSVVRMLGKVTSNERKYTALKIPIEEIYLLDQDMTLVKITVFGKIPKLDRLGLRPGRVLEVLNGKIKAKYGARYINVSYNTEGCGIKVLPKDDERSLHILSSIGKKRKPRWNVSRATRIQTLNDLKSNGAEGLFEIRDCKVTNVNPFVYKACAKCKKGKKVLCENRFCTSKSEKSRNVLGIRVAIQDSSTRGQDSVNAVMFGDIGTHSVMSLSADVFMRHNREKQISLLESAYLGKKFSVNMFVNTKRSMWVIQNVERKISPEITDRMICRSFLSNENVV